MYMDDNYIINRIINILENNNQNLLLGNINSPRPGSICQVNTDYGIKEAYNINCTYPGDAIVVWDSEEEQYYCFTDKPSEVVSSRQLSYRKYRNTEKLYTKSKYVLILECNFYNSSQINQPESVNNTFFVQILNKLNKKNKKLYISKKDVNNLFFGMLCNDLEASHVYEKLFNYLITIGYTITYITDKELDIVDGTLWLPLFGSEYNPDDFITNKQVSSIKKIASEYGVILQGEWNDWILLNTYYINTFYNTSKKTDIINSLGTLSYNLMYNNINPNKNNLISSAVSGIMDINLFKDSDVLAYTIERDQITNLPINDKKYASVVYWES